MNFIKKLIFIILILNTLNSGSVILSQNQDPPFLEYLYHPWVDSVLNTLTVDQKIAQCIWVAGYSNRDVSHEVEISDIIRKYGIGGIIFFQGTAEKQAELTNYYQKITKVPLIIALDAEWGVGMRLADIDKFPYQMTLGAIKNDSLIYQLGKTVANQFIRLGMHINLAPVSDININQMNPVINYRSFGESRDNVAAKSIMYMKGMQDNGVSAAGKHFPGHGDTNVDSHLSLPSINHPRSRLDSIELYPFRKLIDNGISCIMTAHLNLPSLDTVSGLPSTLSPVIIKNLLIKEMGFRGIIITDAMNMKGVTNSFKSGVAEAKALEAGNDVVEFVTDVEATIRETKNSILSKKLNIDDITLKCRKILALKYWSGLNKPQTINKDNINPELSPVSSKAFIRDLYANAITILNNSNNILPVKNLQDIKIATLAINRNVLSVFQQRIGKYQTADNYFIDPSDSLSCKKILKKLSEYDLVITGIFGLDQRPNFNYGITTGLKSFLDKLIKENRTIITWFGNPYGINRIESLQSADGLIVAYQENDYTEDLSAQLIYGGIGARGSLPVTINKKWPLESGIITAGNFRLQYSFPENENMSSEILNRKIDSIVSIGLAAKAFPGCEVMVARNGAVIFGKTYGFQTYERRILLMEDDLFDLASLTKISATLPGLMLLDTEGKFTPDATLGSYLPEFRRSNKSDLLLRDMLTHQAGLTAWIPFWKETVKKDGNLRSRIYNSEYSEKFPVEVAQGLYINRKYRKKIINKIAKSPVGEKKYVYSDLTFIMATEIIEKLSEQRWDNFVKKNIYEKIGASDICFNPYQKYDLNRIVPTEYDSLFRKKLLHGTVHDEAAAMLGGISGHSGLFATANDLMKLIELYRRMGEYGGEQLISYKVMAEYTSVQFPENDNRRGLGFDKPLLNNSELTQKNAYPARSASPSSFGHSGYTGTFVWIDPEYGISYIFLCNRVYPTRENNRLADLNIRSDILQAIYDSIKKTDYK